MSPQTCAVTVSGGRQEKRKTVQVTTPLSAAPLDRLNPDGSLCHHASSANLIHSQYQQLCDAARDNGLPLEVFDPSDPIANAGYVQARGTTPDKQSGLSFDPG